MKRAFLAIGTLVATFFLFSIVHAQVSGSYWLLSSGTLKPVNAVWSLTVPQLGGGGTKCVQVDNNGLFSVAAGACGSGSGTDPFTHPAVGQSATTSLMLFNGQATSTQESAYYAYFGGTATDTINTAGVFTLGANMTANADNAYTIGDATHRFSTFNVVNVENGTAGNLILNPTSGAVGIGSSTPFATLSVNPTAGIASNKFVVGSSTETDFLVNNSGNVGIGTTNPLALLSVNGLASSTSLTVSGISGSTQCVHVSSTGALSGTGSDCAAGSSPGGSNTDVQFNNSSAFGGSNSFVWNNASGFLGVGSTTPWGVVSISNESSTTPALIVGTSTAPSLTAYIADNTEVAISFDNNLPIVTGTGGLTEAFTTSGVNRYLVVGILVQSSGTCSGVTYAGTAMTQLTTIPNDGVIANETLYIFGLSNPALGNNNIISTCTGGVTTGVMASSFNNAQTATAVEASNTATGNSGTPSVSVTTLTKNDWVVGYARTTNSMTASTNTVLRGSSNSNNMVDTNAPQTSTGSHSLNVTQSSGLWAFQAIALKPYMIPNDPQVGIGTTTPEGTFSVQGIGGIAVQTLYGIISGTEYLVNKIDQWGHRFTGGPAPTCGTGCSAVVGDDNNMRVTTGSGVSSVAILFANAWKNSAGTNISPICLANEESAGSAVTDASSTPTTTTIFLGSALTTKFLAVHCEASESFTF